MTKQEIRKMLGEQLVRLESTARTHENPRVQACVSREMGAIARVLLGQDSRKPELAALLRRYVSDAQGAAKEAAKEASSILSCLNMDSPALDDAMSRLTDLLESASELAGQV